MFRTVRLALEAQTRDWLALDKQGRASECFLCGFLLLELHVAVTTTAMRGITGNFRGKDRTKAGEGLFELLLCKFSGQLLDEDIVRG